MQIWVNTHGQEALFQLSGRCDPPTRQPSAHLFCFSFCPSCSFSFFFNFPFSSFSFPPFLHTVHITSLSPYDPPPFSIVCFSMFSPLVLNACVCVRELSNSIPIPAHYRKQMGNWAKSFFVDQHQAFLLLWPLMQVIIVCACTRVCASHTALSARAHFLGLHSFIPTLYLWANTHTVYVL